MCETAAHETPPSRHRRPARRRLDRRADRRLGWWQPSLLRGLLHPEHDHDNGRADHDNSTAAAATAAHDDDHRRADHHDDSRADHHDDEHEHEHDDEHDRARHHDDLDWYDDVYDTGLVDDLIEHGPGEHDYGPQFDDDDDPPRHDDDGRQSVDRSCHHDHHDDHDHPADAAMR
jgi:hypothetical protein